MGLVEDVAAGEFAVRVVVHIAVGQAAVMVENPGGALGAKEFLNFGGGPYVKGAFAFFMGFGGVEDAVGVFGGEEAAERVGHVAEDVFEDGASGGCELRIGGDLKGFEVADGELGLIVKHLLEMRNEPAFVNGVPMEASAQVVVHAAAGHLAEGSEGHVESFFLNFPVGVAEEEIENSGTGELGGVPESSVVFVESAAVVEESAVQGGGIEACSIGDDCGVFTEFVKDIPAGFQQLGAAGAPGFGDLFEDRCEAGAAVAGIGGEVSAAKEGGAGGGKEDGHGPAAATGGGLDKEHVDAVNVRAFFAV